MIQARSIRIRVMLLFCAVVAVLLATAYAGFYLMFQRVVRDQLDQRLAETAGPIIADLMADPTEDDVSQLDLAGQYFEVLDGDGRILQRSRNLDADLPLNRAGSQIPKFQTVQTQLLGEIRAGAFPFSADAEQWVLIVGASTREAESTLSLLRRAGLVLFPLSLLVTAVVSGAFANRSLKPVAELTRQALGMIQQLSHSTPSLKEMPADDFKTQDELRMLAITFNRLFAQLDSVVGQLRQFVSDASHELRTPLSVLRGETELLLTRPRTTSEYETAVRIMDEELKKLSRIVDGLFTLSMADAGQLRIAAEPLYLEEVLDEACAMAAPLASRKLIQIDRDVQRDVVFSGDAAFLRQLFLIFIDNAIKYSNPNTRLRISLRTDHDIEIRFDDQGIGIAKENLPRIYERFYRVAQPGFVETHSGGLGLAIAQAIVKAHEGEIDCVSQPGVGSVFTIRLPLGSAANR